MLYAVIVHAVMTPAVSHLVARRPYRLVLDRALMGQSLRFGWPLLVNGILLFGVFQGDKLIVGRELGMETLAIFAMGFTLTLTPTLVMAKSVHNFFLPQLSAVDRGTEAGRERFQYLAMVIMQTSLVMGLVLVIVVFLFGGPLVRGLLGEKYQPLIPLLTSLAVMQAVRVAKTGPSVVALSCGHTSNAMQANMVRIAALPLAWYALHQGAGVFAVILIALMGEMMGCALSFGLLLRKPGISLRGLFWPSLLGAVFLGLALLAPLAAPLPVWLQGAALLTAGAASLALMTEARRYVARCRRQE
jgi:O-antigen/teichoic acid export membrane protein